MFHVQDVVQLKDGEEIRAIVRRHIVTLVPLLFLAMVLIVLPFFLLFPLFSWSTVGVILFFAAIVIGIVLALRTLILWDAGVLIVTNVRLIDVHQRGILHRTVSEALLSALQDVSWSRKGMIETIFRMGSLHVQTSSTAHRIDALRIPHPDVIYELINEVRHGTIAPHEHVKEVSTPKDDRDLRLERIRAMLEGFPLEELVRIEAVLDARIRSGAADAFLIKDQHGTSS